MPRFVLTSRIAAPAQACFDLSLSVDAHTASMADSGERAIGGVTSGAMQLGDTVTWRARHFGIAFSMTSRISAYERPACFVDEQVSGPFACWWHEHRFDECDGVTTMTDTVDFRPPLGPLGRVVDAVFLTRYMTRLIEQRNAWLAQTLAQQDGAHG